MEGGGGGSTLVGGGGGGRSYTIVRGDSMIALFRNRQSAAAGWTYQILGSDKWGKEVWGKGGGEVGGGVVLFANC